MHITKWYEKWDPDGSWKEGMEPERKMEPGYKEAFFGEAALPSCYTVMDTKFHTLASGEDWFCEAKPDIASAAETQSGRGTARAAASIIDPSSKKQQ